MTNHEEMEEQLIETVDEEGNIINFELIDIIDMDGNTDFCFLKKKMTTPKKKKKSS